MSARMKLAGLITALALAAGSALAQTPNIAGPMVPNSAAGGGTPGGSSGQLQYNNAGSFGGLTGSSVSGSNLTLGGTLTLPNGTVAAPSLVLRGTNTGILSSSANELDVTIAGVGVASYATNGRYYVGGSQASINFGGGDPSSVGTDLILARDAANTLALRNGTNAQTFNAYGSFVDASNYSRLRFNHNGTDTAVVSAEKSGTGLVASLVVQGSAGLYLNGSTSALHWFVNTSGHFTANTDNTYDIGASANRPRDEYLARNLYLGKITATASAPGAGTSKLELVCGTGAGTAKLIIYAGTSSTAVTVTDNIGTGVTGC